ncbi:MAG: hypothetical protein KZQ97_11305 [Candidatus Thiodiazotropha sp. (ex Dulcina madagascariensis)]|nr:hypothetical protein [Candidatus Thiodiazotropha sp. (ex Dulcina madagascariensis)]
MKMTVKMLGSIHLLTLSINGYSESLAEISSFANGLCDQIIAEGSTSKTKILASLNGNLKPISKLLGAKIGASGKVEVDNFQYRGLPFDELSEQMMDSRNCKSALALAILDGRQKIQNGQTISTNNSAYIIDTSKNSAILLKSPNFKLYTESIISVNAVKINLFQNTPIEPIGGQYIENTKQGQLYWQKIRVLAGEHKSKIGWVMADNISFK